MSRRRLYRRSKRRLAGLLAGRWTRSRLDLEPAIRRFLRSRPRAYLVKLLASPAFALAAAATLCTAGSTRAPPPIELADVAVGDGGFVINGAVPFDYAGWSVSNAGDLNGDGTSDVIVGAWGADACYEGHAYVVFGKADGTPVELLEILVGGDGGFAIISDEPYSYTARSVSGAGDVNGDGLADVIVGAPGANGLAGESYVVFGKADSTPVDLADLAGGTGGFVINGVAPIDEAGYSVSAAGDVNGDGLADLVVGTLYAGPDGVPYAGQSYVVFGKADGTPVDLINVIRGSGGFVMCGIDESDVSGVSVSGAGDVNGDGLADVIVGAPSADRGAASNVGESYVVFGKADSTPVDLADVSDGIGGFLVRGIDAGDNAGRRVAGAGDVNGDGLADVIVGAFLADPGGRTRAGESYVVFGKADTTPVDLLDVFFGSGGFIINGVEPYDRSGIGVASAGDVNGDGLDDVVVGAFRAGPNDNIWAGASYVVLGKADTTPVELADVAAGNGGFVMNGVDAYDSSGWFVSGGADFNGDGLSDVIIGAFDADPGGSIDAGESYVVFSPFVVGDLTGDGVVSTADLLALLSAWGACPKPCVPFCPGDLDRDCAVSTADLLILLANWG